MPTTARVTLSQSTATGAAQASSTATMPEISVIGSTPARVTTNHRVTPSTTPASGGLVVCHAYRHAANRSESAGVVLTAASLRPTACRAAGSETGHQGSPPALCGRACTAPPPYRTLADGAG